MAVGPWAAEPCQPLLVVLPWALSVVLSVVLGNAFICLCLVIQAQAL